MISLLLFLFPAGLSLKIKDDYFKEEMNIKDYVLTFIKYSVIINLCMFTILFLYNANKEFMLSVSLDELGFIFKYMLVSFGIAVIVPLVDEYLKKFIKFKITIRKVDKNVKKNSK